MTTEAEGRAIQASLKRQDQFFRNIERTENPQRLCIECGEPAGFYGGRCFECRGRSMMEVYDDSD